MTRLAISALALPFIYSVAFQGAALGVETRSSIAHTTAPTFLSPPEIKVAIVFKDRPIVNRRKTPKDATCASKGKTSSTGGCADAPHGGRAQGWGPWPW
jgi:hypothetical protein